ncbi:MAG: tetratricopeptide repeat protein [Chitinophagales bacterium]|nr:tetratricopeptide repeat protein [Chitinophagales bacterium]
MLQKFIIRPCFLLALAIATVLPVQLKAQQTAHYTAPETVFRDAVSMFEVEQYWQAQQLFIQFLASPQGASDQNKWRLWQSDANYYNAVCAMQLNQPDAEYLLKKFLKDYSNTTRANNTRFYLGVYNFRKNQFKEAIQFLEKVDLSGLSFAENQEANFCLAYSYFITKKNEKALPIFKGLANGRSKYAAKSTYYAGFISYNLKNIDDAAGYFEKVKLYPDYELIVPYYLCRIYFSQKKYEQLLSYAEDVLKKENVQNKSDIQYLIGQTYFQKKEYANALTYLTAFAAQNKKMRKDDLYQIAFAQYKTGDYKNAIEHLKDLNVLKDTLGQFSLYILGDCYLQTNNKTSARTAFSQAAKFNFDKEIAEQSEFLAAKLAFDEGLDEVSLTTLQSFVKEYPDSKMLGEAKEMLTDIYVRSNNYAAALELLESINNKSPRLKAAYQKAAFCSGVQKYHNRDFHGARNFFERSLRYPVDNQMVADAAFWKGEIAYYDGSYQDAILEFNKYLSLSEMAGAKVSNNNLANVYYDLAYCYLKMQKHDQALQYLNSCLQVAKEKSKLWTDVNLRIADCYFVQKIYDKATSYYNNVIEAKGAGNDYALYQKGIILGLTNDNAGKIEVLSQVAVTNPKSVYVDDSKIEIANTYFNDEKYKEAEGAYADVITNYPKSPFYKKARVQMALVYVNTDQDEKALEAYKDLVKDFPNSPEATESLLGIRNLYIDKGDANGFLGYLKTQPGLSLSASNEDSLLYEAAENNFNTQKYNAAIEGVSTYVDKYPKGYFIPNALFVRAESYVKQSEWGKAFTDFTAIANMSPNDYTERSVQKAAYIAYVHLKDYPQALNYYQLMAERSGYKKNKAEGILGAMRSAYKLEKNEICAKYAQTVSTDETYSTVDQNEAHFYLGKMAFNANDTLTAEKEFSTCLKNNKGEQAAEARFCLAKIKYMKGNYQRAEDACYDIINEFPTYEHWIGETLLLLADVYTAEKEYIQAKSTLETLFENVKDTALQQRADEKMIQIQTKESNDSKLLNETPSK